jgi:hypothetical protein
MQNKIISTIVSIILIFIGCIGYFETLSEIQQYKLFYENKIESAATIISKKMIEPIDIDDAIKYEISIKYAIDSKEFYNKLIIGEYEYNNYQISDQISLLIEKLYPMNIEINYHNVKIKDSLLYDKLFGIFMITLTSIGVFLFFNSMQTKN